MAVGKNSNERPSVARKNSANAFGGAALQGLGHLGNKSKDLPLPEVQEEIKEVEEIPAKVEIEKPAAEQSETLGDKLFAKEQVPSPSQPKEVEQFQSCPSKNSSSSFTITLNNSGASETKSVKKTYLLYPSVYSAFEDLAKRSGRTQNDLLNDILRQICENN